MHLEFMKWFFSIDLSQSPIVTIENISTISTFGTSFDRSSSSPSTQLVTGGPVYESKSGVLFHSTGRD